MCCKSEPNTPIPTIEAVQRDVSFAIQFRLELIKLILTLAPAFLAFTIAFRPKLAHPDWQFLMWVGWISLGIATFGAMANMYGWERYYISYRDYKNDLNAGKSARHKITAWRRAGAILQFAGFGVGIFAIAIFAARNLDKVVAG